MATTLAQALAKQPSLRPFTASSERLSGENSNVTTAVTTTATTAVAEAKPITPAQKGALAVQLGACLVTQRTYGKQGADMEAIMRVFMDDLKEFEPDAVLAAISQWRLKSAEFPTPYDIKQLLKPEPIWSASIFQELVEKRKRGDILGFREEEYIKQFKANALKGL